MRGPLRAIFVSVLARMGRGVSEASDGEARKATIPGNRHRRSEGEGKGGPIEAIFSYKPLALIRRCAYSALIRRAFSLPSPYCCLIIPSLHSFSLWTECAASM